MNRLNVEKELLPCPFCGGHAKVIKDASPAGYMIKYVSCLECECRTGDFLLDKQNNLLIEAWNRRK